MLRVAIVTESARPGRSNEDVARWVYEIASRRADAEFELVDIAANSQPLPPDCGQYAHERTRPWDEKVGSFDAYVLVTPEYNRSTFGALKSALDCLFREWNNKATGFVSYGGAGGVCATASLRQSMGEPQGARVRARVMLSPLTDCGSFTLFKPGPQHEKSVHAMLDEVIASGGALKAFRALIRWLS
jgi:NAD(P)H-dependent FMN reductase